MSSDFMPKRLEGYLTIPEMAEKLGMTHQGVNWLIFRTRGFDVEDVRLVGTKLWIVKTKAVEAYMKSDAYADFLAKKSRTEPSTWREDQEAAANRAYLGRLLGEANLFRRQKRSEYAAGVLGRPVDNWRELPDADVRKVIAALESP